MKQQFLDVYDEEHARTLRVLHAYPEDKLNLRPHPKLKTARELPGELAAASETENRPRARLGFRPRALPRHQSLERRVRERRRRQR